MITAVVYPALTTPAATVGGYLILAMLFAIIAGFLFGQGQFWLSVSLLALAIISAGIANSEFLEATGLEMISGTGLAVAVAIALIIVASVVGGSAVGQYGRQS